MPFRDNHSPKSRASFYKPVEQVLKNVDGCVRLVSVDVFAELPTVEDFSPDVQLRAGVLPKKVGSVLFRPGLSDISDLVERVESHSVSEPSVSVEPSDPSSNQQTTNKE